MHRQSALGQSECNQTDPEQSSYEGVEKHCSWGPRSGCFQYYTGQKLKDIRMATLVDDIKHLRLLFQKCSFCLVDNDVCHVSSGISKYALGILQDEEVQIPQCSNALLV